MLAAMPVPFVQIDAFTDRPFSGNPAVVCLLDRPGEPAWMQAVAAEMNVPATAFVREGPSGHALHWFSPTVELELCGHGTLAAAHALWDSGWLPPGVIARFHTKSGMLVAGRRDERIEIDFPADAAAAEDAPAALREALGVAPAWTGRTRLDWLVELDGAKAVRDLTPDLARLASVPTRGVIVTARGDDGRADFVSRFFAPRAGIPEDHVTGSAHCCLAPYWAVRLGRAALTGYQASPRGGVVHVRLAGDRVIVGGQAVTVLRGELL